MTRLEITSRVGPDGVLNLRIPMGAQQANQDVLVTVEPGGPHAMNQEQWREFVHQTAGSISDPSSGRRDQGQFERRDGLS